MPDFSTILVPLDQARAVTMAVKHARTLARHFEAAIVLVHVLADGEDGRAAKDALDQLATAELEGFRVTCLVEHGDPKRVLVDVARRERARLVVVHPRAPISSVTEAVLATPCPVWSCARSEELASLELGNIACGVDFTPPDEVVMTWAADVARATRAKLTLVHVTPATTIYGPGGPLEAPALKHALIDAAVARMQSLALRAPTGTHSVIGSGDIVADALSRAAVSANAELLVIGRRPSRGMVGGNCYHISRDSQIPVLSVPT